jgi:pantetheine-phosphate adenylyltransferase
MPIALCPGSYDPVTNGHIDVIERVARHFDEVIVAIAFNPTKSSSVLFGLEERQDMLHEALTRLPNIRIGSFTGLLVDYATSQAVSVIVKGLRAVSDFDYELQMAQMNQKLTGIDTLFVAASPAYSFLSSSLVKEVARFGGDVSGLVPAVVEQRLKEKFS